MAQIHERIVTDKQIPDWLEDEPGKDLKTIARKKFADSLKTGLGRLSLKELSNLNTPEIIKLIQVDKSDFPYIVDENFIEKTVSEFIKAILEDSSKSKIEDFSNQIADSVIADYKQYTNLKTSAIVFEAGEEDITTLEQRLKEQMDKIFLKINVSSIAFIGQFKKSADLNKGISDGIPEYRRLYQEHNILSTQRQGVEKEQFIKSSQNALARLFNKCLYKTDAVDSLSSTISKADPSRTLETTRNELTNKATNALTGDRVIDSRSVYQSFSLEEYYKQLILLTEKLKLIDGGVEMSDDDFYRKLFGVFTEVLKAKDNSYFQFSAQTCVIFNQKKINDIEILINKDDESLRVFVSSVVKAEIKNYLDSSLPTYLKQSITSLFYKESAMDKYREKYLEILVSNTLGGEINDFFEKKILLLI